MAIPIPSSGEAGAWIRGRVGGSRGRRRRGFRRRFSSTHWVPYFLGNNYLVDDGNVFVTTNAPTIVVSFKPDFSDQSASRSGFHNSTAQLLRYQGGVWVTPPVIDAPEDNAQTNITSSWLILWYWKMFETDYVGGSISVGNLDPVSSSGSGYPNESEGFWARRDINRWGMRWIHRHWYQAPYYANTTQASYTHDGQGIQTVPAAQTSLAVNTSLNFAAFQKMSPAFIPGPRIPKGGLRFQNRNQLLNLVVKVVTPGSAGLVDQNGAFGSVNFSPMMRFLVGK